MRRYRDTKPYRITARYAFTCSTCKQPQPAGAQALSFPRTKSIECDACRRQTEALMYEERTGSPFAC
jgi:hypothetical protein